MRRTLTIISVIFILGGVFPAAAFCLDAESISGEVARLGREAPTLAAFPDTAGVLWMNSDSYSLTGEGGKKHDNTFVMLLGDASAGGGASSRRMPYPRGDGAALEITEAAFYDPSSGARLGDLPRREYDIGGIKGVEVAFPEDAEGFAVVIAYTETVPGDYYLDDVIFLAGELPAWEQTVTVEVPDGMKIYWDGEGIGTPESVKNGRIERTTWTVLNEPEWRNAGMIDSGRPILA
ncbi:MAG: hypothetical protein LBQ36_09985, partial [Synergistaceae bacterium]|nr:hypothetical protein [Synergistaceae bacterium]